MSIGIQIRDQFYRQHQHHHRHHHKGHTPNQHRSGKISQTIFQIQIHTSKCVNFCSMQLCMYFTPSIYSISIDMCHHRHQDPDTIRIMTFVPMKFQMIIIMESMTVNTVNCIRRSKIAMVDFSSIFHRLFLKQHRRPNNNTTNNSISIKY